MLRKTTRERREYLYRKSLEEKERQAYERRKKVQEALREGKPIPTELREFAAELSTAQISTTVEPDVDDEYRNAGVEDPKVLVTTSRDPSSRLQQFAKEMKLIFPNAQRVNRGNQVLKDIADTCRANQVTDLIILHEHRGQPDAMIISHFPYGPTAYFVLHNVVLRHDIPDRSNMSEAYPHLIFEGLESKLGKRITNILKYCFPVPKEESKRVISFVNVDDYISFRHHVYGQTGKEVVLSEVGPRFELRPFQVKLGTADQAVADVEWVYRPYMNTARKRDIL